MKYFVKNLLLMLAFTTAGIATLAAQAEPFRKAVYMEGLGSGVAISTHFDMRLQRGRQDGPGVRIGIGGLSNYEGYTTDGDYVEFGLLTLPVGFNYLVGQRRNSFEMGVGTTFLRANIDAEIDETLISGNGWGVLGFVNLGYRLQPLRNGLLLRINWSPAFGVNGFQAGWVGFGLGYSFR